ncbi:GGDEF domain-containing protein [Salinimonas chungwhensis]|uniref:GGDEF domain-containing protein n=1 Tax=Salinimonas chungwhensis TaxID=265425 RepID=UPI00036B563B|nr:GGDEF domain-containing protein [Salinimonas chungwhensis]
MLDTFTLLVCTTLINAMMIVTLIALYQTSSSQRSILDWLGGISCFFGSNTVGIILSLTSYEQWLLPALANTLFVAGNGLILSGICRYLHNRSVHKLVVLVASATFFAHLFSFVQQNVENRSLVVYPLIIALCGAAAVLLGRRQWKSHTTGLLPLTIVIAVFTLQLAARFIALAMDKLDIPIFSNSFIINSGMLFLMLYVMALAMSMAYLINWAREQNLKQMSQTDTLTGWLNRRAFTSKMPALFDSTQRQLHPLACIVLDIDFFKQVNDNYGHAMGDEVLIHVSHEVRKVTRDCEYHFRMGGEEFVLLLPDCDENQALRVAERVRVAVESSPYVHDGGELYCSVSLGVAVMPAPACDDWDRLLQEADNALYQAKASGRNTTCLNTVESVKSPAANCQNYEESKNLSA